MIDRILARYGYWKWPEKNGIRDTNAVARGMRWQTFYDETGGLADTIKELRRGYFEKAAHLKPGDTEALLALSLADRILAEIDGTMRQIIVEGQLAKDNKEHAAKIAALPEAVRRRL
jgi:hypothetical protein